MSKDFYYTDCILKTNGVLFHVIDFDAASKTMTLKKFKWHETAWYIFKQAIFAILHATRKAVKNFFYRLLRMMFVKCLEYGQVYYFCGFKIGNHEDCFQW